MNSYIDILSRIFLGQYKDLEEGSKQISDNNDKLIVWIISISTGAIALILSSIDKVSFLSQESMKTIIILLISTIVSGVIGRTLSAISSLIGYKLNSDFVFNIKSIDIPYTNRELKGDETAETIYFYFKSDFQIDFPIILETIKNLAETELEKYNNQMRQSYVEFAALRKQDLDNALKTMNKIMIDSFGLRNDYFDNKRTKSNRVKGIIMRLCTSIHLYFYCISILVFSSVAVLTLIKIYCEFK